MARGLESRDFEWVESPSIFSAASSGFLKEGYLNVAEKENRADSPSALTRAFHRVRKVPDSSGIQSTGWSVRWCVLSETTNGIHLILYKDSSFSKFDAPYDVLPLENCQSFSYLPTHPKSENTFVLEFERRSVFFYPERRSELDSWLQAFKDALNLQDAYCNSSLKGLPRQKALRKEALEVVPLETETPITYVLKPVPRKEKVSTGSSASLPKGTSVEMLGFKMLNT